ncbi:HlyD family secretion protein [Anaerosolibacter carboniphilus]|uniref:HlyD family secretion protein n=1 Tax=Anaerosolibacter carboniphilus TaxID=1417629 RepID=A0A841KPG9_9FIRM|nr:efflux RND transporter periplasmic adaptor subunit [Anaerosolibacter carboniphilus]MBB6213998.1 HlyD family secretion protein [Anaerosolibacter carboniphilus]
MKRIVWMALVILFVLAGCGQKEDDLLRYTGTIEATQYDVTTDIGGMIKELYVEEGDTVEAGKVVALLDDDTLNYSALQQEAGYHAKQEQLNDIKKGSREEEIAIAEQELQTAEIALTTAKEQYSHRLDIYNNTKTLFNEGAVNEQQLKDVKLQLDQAEANVQNAEKGIEKMRSKVALVKKGATQETVKSSEYSVAQSKYAYEQALIQKEKVNVKAVNQGVVLYKYYHKGEFLSAGAPIVTLMNTEDLWMKIYVPEKDIHQVKIGKEVNLLSDTVKDQKMKGKVVFISPQAEFTPSNVTTKEDRHNRVHEVKVKVIEGAAQLNPGMVLDADLGIENSN